MKNYFKVLGLFLASGMLLTACGGGNVNPSSEGSSAGSEPSESTSVEPVKKTYTYRDYVAVSPSNWNELTYQDNNDRAIMDYIASSFYTFNYAFDENHNIIDGGYAVEYDAATSLEDVTKDYAGNEKYAVPAKAESGYAYKLTFRNDLKWDDGTPIKAEDFVYSMKEQLNPLFQNYRADSFYIGGTIIHNAMNYVKQGQDTFVSARSLFAEYSEEIDSKLIFHNTGSGYDGATCAFYDFILGYASAAYIAKNGMDATVNAVAGTKFTNEFASLEGKTLAEIKADADLKAAWDAVLGFWKTQPNEELDFFVTGHKFPEVNFEDVGIFVGENELELIIVLDKTLELLNEDGELTYKAAYNMSSLPLVKRDLYEACKVAPQSEGGLWTSKYNSSVETSASWGPYKLTYFQAGKQFILDRNENWFGYNMPEYAGQYQTDRIITETISSWNTAFLLFEQGDIQGIGIDASIAADYKNSQRARFTADDYVGSMQLQSSEESLRKRSDAEHNKLLLLYQDFRQALSLGIDRADYCNKVTTASLAGFGLFNSMHYYDVENGGVYRNEDVAKRVICDVYGVNVEDYDSLDEAYAAVTGYNLTLARELLTKAYNQAKEDGNIADTDKVVFTIGASALTEGFTRQVNYLRTAFQTLAEGTPLEGRIDLEMKEFGDSWANDFRAGAYDICTGGWSGAAWDPGYFLLAYLSPQYMYSAAWDTSSEMLTFNPYEDDDPEHEYTMSLMDWYNCLNGNQGAAYNWAEGTVGVTNDFRLGIIAQLEKAVLSVYYTVPMYNYFSASLLSYKVEYISNTYNTFMAYGGIRYMRYNYDDATWETIKDTFDYKL